MSTPLDPKLYAQSKRRINRIYGTATSAYRSMAIVRDYKKHGGKYAPKQKTSGLSKWLREKWIIVSDFLQGKPTPCGTKKRRKHACRPSVRVNTTTPITIQEAIRKHGRQSVGDLALKKTNGSETVRINWQTGRVTKQNKL